jgi:uroporphyrinogen decarboxylase
MDKLIVPLRKPKPNIENFLDVMSGRKIPDKPPIEEYLIDNALMKPILEDLLERDWVETSDKTEYMGGQMDFSKENLRTVNAWIDNQIEFWYRMGYDYVRVEVSLPLPAISHVTNDTADGWQEHNRAWQGLEEGVIKTWRDFENYPWPRITDDNFYIHQYIADNLPQGLGFITCHAGGVYEHVSRLMGYTGLCYKLYDDRDLVKAVTDKVGNLIYEYNKKLMEIKNISAILQGEDFGFNTQTLIPPDDIRELFFPWHRKYSQQIHKAEKLYFLHSCGKVDELMEEFIDDLNLDGKHSFEDAITPVWEYKERWGDRISLLGGIDVHKLVSLSPEDLRKHVRMVIDKCAPGGRFAVGAGNSIPSYCSIENYLTMLDEALK